MERKPLALLSVFDKKGIIEFARELVAIGFDLLSSGGTAKVLRDAGLAVTDVAEISGLPAILDHRVVTLVPQVHGGLLALDTPEHHAELAKIGGHWIDLCCVDLYPLHAAIADVNATRESVIDKTDIGGPTMLRSAAKGRRIVICDPADRMKVIGWLKEGRPNEQEFITNLCAKVEGVIADYCLAAARFHSKGEIDGTVAKKVRDLIYGENPFLKAALYSTGSHPLSAMFCHQVGGADPSAVNIADYNGCIMAVLRIETAWQKNFGEKPFIVVVTKHTNPSNIGVASDPETAARLAIESNVEAVHGGIAVANFTIDDNVANILRTHKMSEGKRILDGVLAPDFTERADKILERTTGRCRLLVNPNLGKLDENMLPRETRTVHSFGDEVVNTGEPYVLDINDPDMERHGDLTEAQKRDLVIAWGAAWSSNSNTTALVRGGMLLANAVGQQSRVLSFDLCLLICARQKHDPAGAVGATDSFTPFPDAPEVFAKAKVAGLFATSKSSSPGHKPAIEVCQKAGMTLWRLPDEKARGFAKHVG